MTRTATTRKRSKLELATQNPALPRFHQDASSHTTLALQDGHRVCGLVHADVISGLEALPADTFHVAVTSPPYFWARDYGFDGQIGHEESVDEYVQRVCDVFDQVKRTLHPQGVFYLNIGDTYYSGNGQPHGEDPRSPSRNFMRKRLRPVDRSGWSIPKKSLIGVPWKVAFEMQARGWTLRSSIIWNRGNAFVEPTARDRPYRQYENIFLFSKTRFYNYDRSQIGGDEDVWNIPIARQKSVDHSAAFPRELTRRCILTGSPPGGFVLDPFLGSGTTVDVALEHGRVAVGVDLSSAYIKAVASGLLERSYSPVSWDLLDRRLRRTPTAFSAWPGNILNFRKPGTPKVAGPIPVARSASE